MICRAPAATAPSSEASPTPPEPDHGRRLAGLQLRRIDDRTDARQHRAAEQRRLHERQVGRDLHQRAPRHHRVIGECRAAEMVVHHRPVAMQPARARQQGARAVRRRPRLAQRRTPFRAGHAMAAARHEDHHHMIARGEVGHVLAQFLDDAGRLVPERHRHRPRPVAVDDGEVGVAQSGRHDPHQHLAPAGRIELDFLDRERLGSSIGRLCAHTVAAPRP